MNTLKGRLIAVFVVIGLVGLGTLGILAVNRSSDALMESAEKEGIAITNSVTQLVDNTIKTEVSVVQLIASSTSLRTMKWETQKNCIAQLDMGVTGIEEIWLVERDGTARYVDGTILDLGSRDYVKKAFSTGKTFVSNPVKSAKTGEMVVVTAVPVVPLEADKKGALLCGRIPLKDLQKTVSEMTWGKTGYVFIVDKGGLLMVHPSEKYLGVLNVSEASKAVPEALAAIVRKGLNGEEGIERYPFEGRDKLAAYSPSSYTGWVVASSAYADEFMEPIIKMRNTIAMITVALIILIVLVSYFIAKAIARPIEGAVSAMRQIATGDLNVTMTDRSSVREMKQLRGAIEEMVTQMSRAMTTIKQSARTVLDRAQDVNAGIEEANATVDQVLELTVKGNDMAQTTASAVAEASASIEEVAEGAQAGAKNAVEAGGAAQTASQDAREGNQALEEMVSVISDVNGAGVKVGEAIDSLNHSVDSIGQFVITITTIADQTNLLALNAAIEAARAGEHGRGFAVVAEEVRKLAEESNQAAKNVETLINEITNRTRSAASDQGRVASFMTHLVEKTDQTREIFVNLVDKMNDITENVQSIAAAAEEQSASTEEMSSGVEHIADNTRDIAEDLQTITRGMEEESQAFLSMARSTEELVDLSNKMEKVTEYFKLRSENVPAKLDE